MREWMGSDGKESVGDMPREKLVEMKSKEFLKCTRFKNIEFPKAMPLVIAFSKYPSLNPPTFRLIYFQTSSLHNIFVFSNITFLFFRLVISFLVSKLKFEKKNYYLIFSILQFVNFQLGSQDPNRPLKFDPTTY